MNNTRKLSALTALTLGLAIPVGGGAFLSSASAVEGVGTNTNCTPVQAVEGKDAVYFNEHEFTREVKVPGNGLPAKITVDNPKYVAPVEEVAEVSHTDYEYVTKDWTGNVVGQRWAHKDSGAISLYDGKIWFRTGVTNKHVEVEYVAPVAEVGPKQIEVDNPDYVGETTKTESVWVREDKINQLDRGLTATGAIRATTEVKTPAVQAVEGNTCETKTISWVLAEGSTKTDAFKGGPQPLFNGECTPDPRDVQIDTYKYGTAAEKAIVDALDDDGVLSAGEDSSVYLKHTWGKTNACGPETVTFKWSLDVTDPTCDTAGSIVGLEGGKPINNGGWEFDGYRIFPKGEPKYDTANPEAGTYSFNVQKVGKGVSETYPYGTVLVDENGLQIHPKNGNDTITLTVLGATGVTQSEDAEAPCYVAPETPEEPETPVEPEQPSNPVEPDEGDEETPVVVTPVVNPVVQPVVQPVVTPEKVVAQEQDELAVTGASVEQAAIIGAGLVAAGALGLVVAHNRPRNRVGRHQA